MFLSIDPNLRVRMVNPRLPQILRRFPGFPPRNPVTVCGFAVNGSGADLARFRRDLARAQAVWGPCNITLVEGTFATITAPLDYVTWDTNIPRTTLLNQGNCPANFVRIYYVGSIDGNTHNGRAQFMSTEAGSVALSRDAHENLFPHELGHLFLGGNEQHRDTQSPADLVNIMRSDVGTIQGFPQVDTAQCARAVAAVQSSRFTGAPTAQGLVAAPAPEVRAFETSSAPQTSPTITSHTASLRDILVTAPDAVVNLGLAVLPQVLMLLTCDPAPAVRAAAAAALGRIGDFAAQMALVGALRDPAPAVRVAVLRALAGIGSPIAMASVVQHARVEPDPNVRATACGLATGMQVGG